MPIKYNPMAKARIVDQDDIRTKIEVNVTPFGDEDHRDLHQEFFWAKTYFGDDKTGTTRIALYEHLLNDRNNPIMARMPKQKMILGKAHLTKTDEWGRWFEFEIQRSLEYHDFIEEMVEKGVMGASTQCFPNGKTVNSNGRIDFWLENEVSLTPTPANPDTLRSIVALAKNRDVDLFYVQDGQIKALSAGSEEELLESQSMPRKTAEPTKKGSSSSKTTEKDASNVDEPVAEFDVDEFVEDIDAALHKDPAKTITILESDFVEMQAQLADIKASMSIFFDLFGADPEELRDALTALFGLSKSLQEGLGEDSLPAMLTRINAKLDGVLKANKQFAHYVRNFKESEAGMRFSRMSAQERLALIDIEEEEEFDDEPKGVNVGAGPSPLPIGAPGSQ